MQPGSALDLFFVKRTTKMFREVYDAALKDEYFDYEKLDPLVSAFRSTNSFPYLLAYAKILEEIAIQSTNDKVWQRAIKTLAEPFERKPKRLSGTDEHALIHACLKNVWSAVELKKKHFLAGVEDEARKSGFLVETFCGALFAENAEVVRKMVCTVCGLECSGKDLEVVNAAMLAFQMSTVRSTPFFQKLAGNAAEIDPENGTGQMMGIIRSDGYQAELNEVYWHIIRGSREIFAPKLPPHNWSLPLMKENGPIPTLRPGELRMALLEALDRMPSGPACYTVLKAWAELVFPHVRRIGKNGVDAEPSVKRAFNTFGESVTNQLARSGAVQPMHLRAFGELFLGKPKPAATAEIDSSTLLLLSPAAERVITFASKAMGANACMTNTAKEALLLGLMHGCDEEGARVTETIGRNVRIMRDRTAKMFQGEQELPSPREVMMEVQKLSRDERLIAKLRASKPPKRLKPRIS